MRGSVVKRGHAWYIKIELGEIARLYRESYVWGRPVTEAVAGAFHVSRSTASKRILAARRAGLLDEMEIGDERQEGSRRGTWYFVVDVPRSTGNGSSSSDGASRPRRRPRRPRPRWSPSEPGARSCVRPG